VDGAGHAPLVEARDQLVVHGELELDGATVYLVTELLAIR